MGLSELFLGSKKKGMPLKCPNCHTDIDSSMERCPKCGVHVSSMFRIRCPKCKEANELKAKKCKNCGYEFEEPKPQKTRFVCPMCGYNADYYMLSCPACGAKFS